MPDLKPYQAYSQPPCRRGGSMSKKYYIAHEVAELLAEVIGDRCACNVNGNDEWLPMEIGRASCRERV